MALARGGIPLLGMLRIQIEWLKRTNTKKQKTKEFARTRKENATRSKHTKPIYNNYRIL